MRAFAGVTDRDWYQFLSNQSGLDEVNFWQPSGGSIFRSLAPGELFLFKLKKSNVIAGGGFFAHSTLLPLDLAWDSFGVANGAASFVELKRLIDARRETKPTDMNNYMIGCVLLSQPFFLPPAEWIEIDWKSNIVQGKGYDLTQEPGLSIFSQIRSALTRSTAQASWPSLIQDLPQDPRERYGQPVLVKPRLGQGTFRVLVTDAYDRRCAVSNEKVLPVLEAAHIKPYVVEGQHRVDNGILLRSDLHILFDRGYLTVARDLRLEVSNRIHEEFNNGQAYYDFNGSPLRLPRRPEHRPSAEFLQWHNEQVFRG
jgi:putative restriction endonuclease